MAVYDQTHKYCARCRTSALHYRKGTNHILHLLLTVFLCGAWLPVWLMLSFKIGGWRCQTCGYAGNPGLRYGGPAVLILAGVFIWFSLLGNLTENSTSPSNRPSQTTHDQAKALPASGDLGASTSDGPEPTPQPESQEVAKPQPEPKPQDRDIQAEATVEETVEAQAEPKPASDTFRIWKDSTGTFKVEAEFVSYAMGTVKLRNRDGQEISVSMEKLSEADQEWVRERGRLRR